MRRLRFDAEFSALMRHHYSDLWRAATQLHWKPDVRLPSFYDMRRAVTVKAEIARKEARLAERLSGCATYGAPDITGAPTG